MDGLAAGVGAIAAIALAAVRGHHGSSPEAAAAFALAGGAARFPGLNFHPARIYLGDAGSLATGISLGALALAIRWTDRSPAGFLAPLAIFVVPLADVVYVSVLRARAGTAVLARQPGPLSAAAAARPRRRGCGRLCWSATPWRSPAG